MFQIFSDIFKEISIGNIEFIKIHFDMLKYCHSIFLFQNLSINILMITLLLAAIWKTRVEAKGGSKMEWVIGSNWE